jgi:hypothetical protein
MLSIVSETKISDDYTQMCRLMVHSHNKLVDQLQDSKIQELMRNDVLLFFGPTKSGKSTLLGRIKSTKTSEEFMKLVEESEGGGDDYIDIEGVPIRGGYLAGTTVPNFYVKSNKLIMDLAGFGDATPGRAEVISLLNNGLFPKLNKCKMLIILDLGILSSLNLIIPTYVKEFKRLLTPQHFREGLASCTFIFTKADKRMNDIITTAGVDKDEYKDVNTALKFAVGEILKTYTIQVMSADDDVAKFCSFLCRNFCIIDYRTMDSVGTIQVIENMLNKIKTLESKQLYFELDSVQNKLSNEGAQVVQYYKQESMNVKTLIQNFREKIVKEHNLQLLKIKTYKGEVIELTKRIQKNTVRLSILDQMIKSEELRNKDLLSKLESLRLDDIQNSLQLTSFRSKSNEFTMLQISTFKSVNYKKSFSEEFKVCGELIRPLGSVSRIQVVFMTLQDYNNQESKIHNCKNIVDFESMNFPILYTNGHNYGAEKKMNIDISAETDDSSKIIASSYFPFVILCLNDIRLIETPHIDIIANYFVSQTNKTKSEIKNTEEELNRMVVNKLSNLDESELLKKSVSVDETELKATMTLLENGKIDYKIQNETFLLQLSDIILKVKTILDEDVFTLTEELGKILVSCHIEVQVFREMPQLRSDLMSIVNEEGVIRNLIVLNNNEISMV